MHSSTADREKVNVILEIPVIFTDTSFSSLFVKVFV